MKKEELIKSIKGRFNFVFDDVTETMTRGDTFGLSGSFGEDKKKFQFMIDVSGNSAPFQVAIRAKLQGSDVYSIYETEDIEAKSDLDEIFGRLFDKIDTL